MNSAIKRKVDRHVYTYMHRERTCVIHVHTFVCTWNISEEHVKLVKFHGAKGPGTGVGGIIVFYSIIFYTFFLLCAHITFQLKYFFFFDH